MPKKCHALFEWPLNCVHKQNVKQKDFVRQQQTFKTEIRILDFLKTFATGQEFKKSVCALIIFSLLQHCVIKHSNLTLLKLFYSTGLVNRPITVVNQTRNFSRLRMRVVWPALQFSAYNSDT